MLEVLEWPAQRCRAARTESQLALVILFNEDITVPAIAVGSDQGFRRQAGFAVGSASSLSVGHHLGTRFLTGFARLSHDCDPVRVVGAARFEQELINDFITHSTWR
ncbi:hypothetical protein D3C83_69690 [compost metagenome]